jgi:hypothetical protein
LLCFEIGQLTQQLVGVPIEQDLPAPPLIPSFCLDPRALLQDILVGAAKAPKFSQAFVFEIDMVHPASPYPNLRG